MKRGRKPKCIHCGSGNSVSKGYRPTTTMGKRSLRVCKDCGRKFTVGRVVVKPARAKPAVKAKATMAEPAPLVLATKP